MSNQLFSNEVILQWLQYYAENTPIDLAQIKMMDITKQNKNLIPTVEANKAVLAFMEAGDLEIFYRMWNAGLGDCEVWYNEGSDPVGPIKHDKLKDMINRGINASAGMLVVNDKFRNTKRSGLDSLNARGDGSEVRAVIASKMDVGSDETVCVIGSGSLAIQAAYDANEGTVVAVEYNSKKRGKLEENIDFFDLRNVIVKDCVDESTFEGVGVPSTVFMVASASMEQELDYLLGLNPNIKVVIYTLDFTVAGKMDVYMERYGFTDPEIIQISVSKLDSKNTFETEPAPWIITCKNEE